MTIKFSDGETAPNDLVSETEEYFLDAARQLAQSIREINAGKLGDAKAIQQVLKDLRVAYVHAVDERARVEKLRKQGAGIAYDYALDFDAARAEIGRRLARLRDAGDG